MLSDNNDTLICFSVTESKFLLKKYYDYEKEKELNIVCDKQLELCDSISIYKDKIITDNKSIIKNQQEIIDVRDGQIEFLKANLELERQNTQTERNKKKIAIIAGCISTSLFGYLWLSK
jgi:hypothetical protein